MDLNTPPLNVSIDKLKCTQCHKFLSYFPIRLGPNKQSICGRCTAPGELIHNVTFETLSQFLFFPCRYKAHGCDKEHQPREVPSHEQNCPFRNIPCPTKKWSDCEWKGHRLELLPHCRRDHLDKFSNEFIIDLARCDESYHLIHHSNMLLIFTKRLNVSTKSLQFEMFSSEFELRPTRYKCQLGAKCGSKTLTFEFFSTSFEEVIGNDLSLESIMNQSGDQNAAIKISVVEEVVKDDEVINVEMLSVLKCFLCSNYATPPIFCCANNNETLCSECKKGHQSSCEPCRRTPNARNIGLDKVANHLTYPCKNQKNGCPIVGKPDKIIKHQKECDLGDFDCPLGEFEDCTWKGPWGEIQPHIQNTHQELVTNSTPLSKCLVNEKMKCDVVKFADRLFRLVCMKRGDKYFWTVQVVGPSRDDFKFEVEIVDQKSEGKKLVVRQPCERLVGKEEIFRNGEGFCYFLEDQIGDFMVDQVITFKIRIFT